MRYGQFYGTINQTFEKGGSDRFLKELAPYGLEMGRKVAGEQVGFVGWDVWDNTWLFILNTSWSGLE